MQPGDTIHPMPSSDEQSAEQAPVAPVSIPTDSQAVPQESLDTVAPEEVRQSPAAQPESLPSPQQLDSDQLPVSADEQITWEASEYIEHQKPAGWYALLVLAAVVVAGLAYWITNGDIVTVVVVAVAACLFGITAARKPRTLRYVVDTRGVTIDSKLYAFSDFKVFSVVAESAIHSVQLLPLKRFMPPISLHYPPEQEEQIVAILGKHLPYQEAGRDAVDRFMSRIRF